MHALDNPIWQALTTSQAEFAESRDQARRFPPEVTLLGAFSSPSSAAYDALAELLSSDEVVALLLETQVATPAGWTIVEAAPFLQMIYQDSKPPVLSPELIELTEADVPEMLALVTLTQPGPFGRRTRELGRYLGIRRAGCLVAMAGERLRMPGYTEVSAVCTHPDHIGQGYAAALITALVARIRLRREQPFLHVRQENTRAIELYARLGFITRRLLHMVVLRKHAA